MTVRVRYAPSPTGLQHIGGVRTALFNYLYARSAGGVFVLRVEDTDQERYNGESLQDIYDTFAWLGISWDEGPDVGGDFGPYIQSERAELYTKYAAQLLDAGLAYYAFDTAEELQAQRDASAGKGGYDRRFRDMTEADLAPYRERGLKPVVRFKVPLEGTTALTDVVLGEMSWENADVVADPVLIKSDGLPTYHLANVVDDHLMQISHIMRAQEWIPSAPLHVLLYQAFGWEPPVFCHLPIVVGEDGQKLSKRHGATRVLEFRERGYLPEALINYLSRVGWSFDDKQEIFSREELERIFRLEKINKAPAVFDYKKLEWLNGHYIRERSVGSLYDAILPFMQKSGIVSDPPASDEATIVKGAIPLIQERLKYLADAPDLLRFLFEEPGAFDLDEMVPKKLDRAQTAALLEQVAPIVGEIPTMSDEENEEVFRAKAAELDTKLGNLLMPLRVAVTGSRVSPPLFGSIRLLGARRAAERVENALRRLKES
ncbi:MAG TPA: glutamate--tRNA ligase [Spirochaetia bacterium]|nr:glutamate--tRNA ligase [Spirochaetia bacterium]